MAREGGQGFFSFDMLKGDGKGRGLIIFYKFMIGGGRGVEVNVFFSFFGHVLLFTIEKAR